MKSFRRNFDLGISCFVMLSTVGISLASAQTPASQPSQPSPQANQAATFQPVPVRQATLRRTQPAQLPDFDTIPVIDPGPKRAPGLEPLIGQLVIAAGCPPQLVAGCSGSLGGFPTLLPLNRYDR